MSSNDSDGRVDMVHPDLPDTVIHPKAGKADAYRAGGWLLKSEADAAAAQAAEASDPDALAVETAPEPEPKKRRTSSAKTEEEA